mmetsp:Transcript_13318/g.27586  ORF Transcript_13318/g.27586 Transcript_13318/m.27586 type:complete len:87 (+) Transcript_13318:362-622(+)
MIFPSITRRQFDDGDDRPQCRCVDPWFGLLRLTRDSVRIDAHIPDRKKHHGPKSEKSIPGHCKDAASPKRENSPSNNCPYEQETVK